jgi:threonine 3-dehydrogenase
MLALRKVHAEKGGLSVDHVDVPDPGPGEVRIKVAASGICGTDLHIYNWLPAYRHIKLPIVMGHEIAGVIDGVGPGVANVKVGDRVSVESHIPCNSCTTCLSGNAHVCGHTRYPGIHINGGFASHVVVPAQIAMPIGPSLSFETAALMEPFGIAVHAAQAGSGVSGMDVLVAGCGPIGLMSILAARALGANRIIATDVNAYRLGHAMACGADRVVDVSVEDVASVTKELTSGRGFDVVIENSGAQESLRAVGGLVSRGGEIRLVGVPSGEVALDLKVWLNKGITVLGLHGRRLHATWVTAFRLVEQRRVQLEPLISHTMGIEEGTRGFEEAAAGRAVKVLFMHNA